MSKIFATIPCKGCAVTNSSLPVVITIIAKTFPAANTCLKLSVETLEQGTRDADLTVNDVNDVFLVSLLSPLKKFHNLF